MQWGGKIFRKFQIHEHWNQFLQLILKDLWDEIDSKAGPLSKRGKPSLRYWRLLQGNEGVRG